MGNRLARQLSGAIGSGRPLGMTTIEQRLQQQIESALREHMLAGRTAVMTALERGRAAASSAPAERTKPAATRPRDASSAGKRRTASELAALSEQLYEVIATHPGEGMIALSARMGVSGTQLQRAVARLRDAERIRTVGVYGQTTKDLAFTPKRNGHDRAGATEVGETAHANPEWRLGHPSFPLRRCWFSPSGGHAQCPAARLGRTNQLGRLSMIRVRA